MWFKLKTIRGEHVVIVSQAWSSVRAGGRPTVDGTDRQIEKQTMPPSPSPPPQPPGLPLLYILLLFVQVNFQLGIIGIRWKLSLAAYGWWFYSVLNSLVG